MVKPIINRFGGKRKHSKIINNIAPKIIDILIDPFFGGGGFSFNFDNPKIILANDIDSKVTKTYNEFKKRPDKFINDSIRINKNHDISTDRRRFFNNKRDLNRKRFIPYVYIFLLKKSYLSKGDSYNKDRNVQYINDLIKMKEYLKHNKLILKNMDYKKFINFSLTFIKKHKFKNPLFLIDPPYLKGKNNNFDLYPLSDLKSQQEISDIIKRIRHKVFAFNTKDIRIRNIYPGWKFKIITTKSNVFNAKGDHKNKFLKEYIFTNF